MIAIKDSGIILNKCFDDEISQEANSTYQLKFNYPVDDDTWEQLKEETLLTADDLHGEQEFSIIEVEKYNGYITVYAKQVATLLNGYSINKLSVDRVNGATVMQALISASNRAIPFTLYSDIEDKHTLNVSNQSVMDTIAKDKHCIIGQWGGDLIRDKYAISLLKNGGSENESLFMYKKNLHTLHGHSSSKNLATRIHFWKKIESHEEGKKDQLIEITLDSPLINKYRNIYEDNVEVNDEKITDIEALKKYGQDYFKNNLCDMIEDTLEIDVIGQPDVPVHMFDVVTIFHERYNVDLRKKITKYTYSPVSKRLKSIGFGQISRTVNSIVHETIENKVDEAIAVTKADFKREFENSNKIVEQKQAELEHRIEDGIEQVKSKAEVVKTEINSDIQSKLSPIQIDVQNFKRDFQNDLSTTKNELTAQISQAKEILSRLQINTESHFSEFNLNANQIRADLELTKSKLIEQSTQSQNKLNNAKRELSQSLNRVVDDVNRFKGLTSEQFNQTSVLISQTKNSLETNISRVESTIPREIGVKNLLINSQGPFKPSENRIDNYIVFTDSYINLVQGQEYILSAGTDGVFTKTHDVRDESDHVTIWLVNGNVNQIISDNSTGSTGTNFIWNHPSGKYFLRINTYRTLGNKSVWNIKIASGSIKTDWTPAIEDSDNKILEIKTKLVQTAEGLTQLSQKTVDSEKRLTRNEADIRRLNDEVSSKVTKTDFDKVNNRLTTTETLVRQTADSLISKVNQTDFDRISGRVSTAETGLTQVDNEIKLKASKSDVDSLTGRVVKAESSIQVANDRITSEVGRVETNLSSIRTTLTQTANVLETKASKTDFDALKQKVSNTETSIRQATDSIQLKANQSDLNTLDHRLNDATAQIRLTASAIEQKVNRSELNDLTGRVSNAESSIRQTVDRINLEISKIPTEFGGRNLLIGTGDWNDWGLEKLALKKAGIGHAEVNPNVLTKVIHWTGTTGHPDNTLVVNPKCVIYLEKNQQYTVSAKIWYESSEKTRVFKSQVMRIFSQYTDSNNGAAIELTNQITNMPERYAYTFIANKSGYFGNWRVGSYTTNGYPNGSLFLAELKLEKGALVSDWTPAPEDTENDIQAVRTRIEQTADSIRQSVSELSANAIKQSDVSITSSGIVMRSGITDPKKSVGDLAAASFRLNPYQIDLFAEKIRVKGDMLVDGAITSRKIASGSIDTAQLRAGAVNTTILSSDAVTADKLRVDEALFNKLSAGEVLAQKLFAKSAFITSVQSVDLSANRITSGMLRARNGTVNFNLDSGQLNFYTDAPALKRTVEGFGNQFLKFETGGYTKDGQTGYQANKTIIGSTRTGDESAENGSFTGLRIWNAYNQNSGDTADLIDVIGDKIAFQDSASGRTRSVWILETYNGKDELFFYPENANGKKHIIGHPVKPFKSMYAEEFYLKDCRLGQALKDIANRIGHNGWADHIG